MASIKLENLHLSYPIYSNVTRSLKKQFFKTLIGGEIVSKDGLYYVDALRDINLNLVKGDRLGISGSNGSGKTTLLRVLAGVLTPSKGRIETVGSINAFIDIHYGMNMEATGIENIKIRCIFLGIAYKDLNTKTDEILEFSELGEYAFMAIKTYSSGMRSRLSFGLSLSFNFDFYLS